MKTNQYITIVIILLLIFSKAKAQQDILYSQYAFSQLAINPAYAGNDDGLSLMALCRNQWFGMPGAPTSYTFMGQSLINKKNTGCSTHQRHKNQKGILSETKNRIGLGAILFNDQLGVSNTFKASFAYSYKIQFNQKNKLSLGLQASFQNYYQSNNQLENPSPADPMFSDNIKISTLNFGTGIFFESHRYYIGISVPQIFTNKYLRNNTKNIDLRQYFLTGGYMIKLNPHYKLRPTCMVRYTEDVPVQFDLNLNLLYLDKIWVGCAYRYTNSLNMNLAILLTEKLRMGLAYDYPLNKINTVSHGSAEVMINYIFMKTKRRPSVSRYF